jgi:hypothetical protein
MFLGIGVEFPLGIARVQKAGCKRVLSSNTQRTTELPGCNSSFSIKDKMSIDTGKFKVYSGQGETVKFSLSEML